MTWSGHGPNTLNYCFSLIPHVKLSKLLMSSTTLQEPTSEVFISNLLFASSRGDINSLSLHTNFNVSDYDGRTPLHLAASGGHLEAVSFLISRGALANARDRFGGSALDDAVRNGHETVSKLLIDSGADGPSSQFETDLINAAFINDVQVTSKLLKTGVDPNCSDYDGRSPLHLAASSRSFDVLKLLLEFGADPTVVDRFGGFILLI